MMEEGYPALVQEPTWQEKMEKLLAEAEKMEKRLAEAEKMEKRLAEAEKMEKRLAEAEKELKIHKGLHKTQMEELKIHKGLHKTQMEELKIHKGLHKTQMEELLIHKGLHKTQMELLFGFCERDVIILAGEILKWSVKKRGENDGEGRQLFDPNSDVKRMVWLGCRAYGEFGSNPNTRHVKDFKAMSQVVIKARNNTVHFQDLEALERMVKSCEIAIKEWTELEAKYPTQVKIIRKYKAFKQHLPECFQ